MSGTGTPSVAMSGAESSRASLGRVPSTWAQAVILSRYQLRDYLRSRRFVLMMSIVALVGVILTAVVAYFRPASLIDNSSDFYGGLWAGGASFVILFAGIIFGGDAIAGEFQNKTGYFLMGLPVQRTTVYTGKYLAALAASLVTLVVFLLIVVGNAAFYLGPGAFTNLAPLLASFVLALLYLLALLGFTFLFSSLFKTSLYAVLVVAVLFLFGFTIISSVATSLAHIEPWFLISYASSIIGYPLTGTPPHIAHIRSPFGGGTMTVYSPSIPEGIAIMAGYFLITSLLGLWLFEREEFT
ncbi:MAG: ABC transporter permease [Thermoplasmata archaeon]|nr:ABC transporter permease [Thermoplasmata archaeon]